jgi:hypothetical protein
VHTVEQYPPMTQSFALCIPLVSRSQGTWWCALQVVTPVRRCVRNQVAHAAVHDMLEQTNFSYGAPASQSQPPYACLD